MAYESWERCSPRQTRGVAVVFAAVGRFYARVRAQDSVPASETALREQIADLRRRLADLRCERDEYKQAADALARALNVLAAENDALRSQASRCPARSRDRLRASGIPSAGQGRDAGH